MLEFLHFYPTTGSLYFDDWWMTLHLGRCKCFAHISVGRGQTPPIL